MAATNPGKNGSAMLTTMRDFVDRAVPEPEVLTAIGQESQRNGTSGLTSRQIDQIIKAFRFEKQKR